MKNVAVMGAGNVGIYAAKAVLESEDMRLCGFIRQKENAVEGFCNVPVASAAERLPVRPDGVIICVPSRRTEAAAKYLLSLGINTVDACDLHEELPRIRRELHEAALRGGAAEAVRFLAEISRFSVCSSGSILSVSSFFGRSKNTNATASTRTSIAMTAYFAYSFRVVAEFAFLSSSSSSSNRFICSAPYFPSHAKGRLLRIGHTRPSKMT